MEGQPGLRSAQLVLKLARAAGLGGMVGGQVPDLAAEQSSREHTEKAVRELGYRPRPAREAIVDAVNWFRANGYLK